MSEKYSVIMVEPEVEKQGKFKTVALEVCCFDKIKCFTSLRNALNEAIYYHSPGVIVISPQFKDEEIKNFITDLKKTEKGQEWVLVALLRPSDDNSEAVNKVIGMGMNGFVFEPYSVDNLQDLEPLAKKVKLQNQLLRLNFSLEVLFSDIAKHLDAIVFLMSSGRSADAAYNKFRDSCSGLGNYRSQLSGKFYDIAARTFINSKPFGCSYVGPSRRVREKFRQKAIEDLEKNYQN